MMAAAHLSTQHAHTNHMGHQVNGVIQLTFRKERRRGQQRKKKITNRTEQNDCNRTVLSVLMMPPVECGNS